MLVLIRHKKRTESYKIQNLFSELKINDTIKEAYIIGVDEQAKKRLENLTESKKVTPINIDTISKQIDDIYVDSPPDNLSSLIDEDDDDFYYYYIEHTEMVKQESAFKQIKNKLISVGLDKRSAPLKTTSTPTNAIKTIMQHDDTLCLSLTSSSKSSTSNSHTDKHKILIHNEIEFHTLENTMFNSTPSVISSTSSMSSPHTGTFTNTENEDMITYGSREMAIDCPDSFQGETKTKPCYPPSKLSNQVSQPFILHEKDANKPHEPHALLESQVESSPIKYIDENQSNQASFHQRKSLKTKLFHEKQKLNREEDHLRKSKVNDEILLRNSLRNSEKLRKLIETKRVSNTDDFYLNTDGMVNNAFVNDESISITCGNNVDLGDDDEEEDSGKDSHPENLDPKEDNFVFEGKLAWKDLSKSDDFNYAPSVCYLDRSQI